MYVDDIIIGSSNKDLVNQLKSNLSSYFKLKDLGILHYFLELEIARSSKGIVVSRRKFVLEILGKYAVLGSKPYSVPMEVNIKLIHLEDRLLANTINYRQLVAN